MESAMNELTEILLVDDNDADNHWNKRIIQRSGLDIQVTVALDGREALDYLTTKNTDGNYPTPGLIFLDINMPRMNGWEFLDAYAACEDVPYHCHTVMMLTTSFNPDDYERAKSHQLLTQFINKPLEPSQFMEIVRKYFPQY